MNQSRIVDIGGIGRVLFEPSRRAKRLILSVKPFSDIRVAVPPKTSFKAAKEFVTSKIPWVQKHLDKMRRLEDDHHALSKKTAHIDKAEAKKKILCRVYELAKLHGFQYEKVFVRNLRSRWGSCSHKNNVSLNMKLVVLPEEMLDYVILHELVHTRIRNHSIDFWKELDGLLGNARVLNARLKRYNIKLL